MIQATQLRPGMIIIYEGDLFRVTAIHHLTPGNKRGFMQTKMKNLKTGIGTEKKFRSEDRLEQATQLRPGMIIIYEGDLFRVTAIHHAKKIALEDDNHARSQ